MLKKFFLLTFFSFTLLYNTASQATLNLQLTEGTHQAIPIAIFPFDKNLAPIIIDDLTHSGRFNVFDTHTLTSLSMEPNTVDFAQWQQRGVNNVLTGQVRTLGAQQEVKFQLLDVYANTQNRWQNAVLLSRHYFATHFTSRALAHQISNEVYHALTGKSGNFSNKIAYIAVHGPTHHKRYQLIVADADGYRPKVLLDTSMPIMSPTWAPNGQSLAYVSFEGAHATIYIQNIKTGHRQKVSSAPGINGAPAFSPDGDYLALVRSDTDYPKLYLLQLHNHQLTQLTYGTSIDTEPCWSANGRSLVFTSNQSGQPQIYRIVIAKGHPIGKPKRLTFQGSYNSSPNLTRDGRYLIMLHKTPGYGFNIAKQDLNTGQVMLLTQSPGHQSPSLSPNDESILFVQRAHTGIQLKSISTDGQTQWTLFTPPHRFFQQPSWGPTLPAL